MDSFTPSSSSAPASGTHKPTNKKRTHEPLLSDLNAEPVLKKPRFSTPPTTALPSTALKAEIPTIKPKKAFIFKYGNYTGYYGYRLGVSGLDPRIDLLEERWFKGKTVLDIGCNAGVLTIRIAKKFAVEAMHGVDIDKSLIDKANKNLKASSHAQSPDTPALEPAKQKFHGGGKLSWFPLSSDSQTSSSTTEPAEPPKYTISFEVANYIRSPTQPNTYDTIMCLSVVKWIHLNWGDAGLRLLLLKVHRELRDNGIFILEIQPFSSYKKVKNLTQHIKTTYASIEIKPDQIVEVAAQLGLKHVQLISPPVSEGKHGTVGFSRPIHVFQKGPVPKRSEVISAASSSESTSKRVRY